ncbi:oxidoreductase [Streptomyces sp. NPDC054775]
MARSDLDDVIGAFAEAAAAAERFGFEGVELHGAHGYLRDQFLRTGTNRRTDAYGGAPVARTKFAAENVAAGCETISPDFPVIFRYSQWKQEAYDAYARPDPGGAGGYPAPACRGRRRRLPRLHPPLLAPGVRGRSEPGGLDQEAHRSAHHHRRLGRPRRPTKRPRRVPPTSARHPGSPSAYRLPSSGLEAPAHLVGHPGHRQRHQCRLPEGYPRRRSARRRPRWRAAPNPLLCRGPVRSPT